jgi:hypothetical protein
MKIRLHRGGLAESMATLETIEPTTEAIHEYFTRYRVLGVGSTSRIEVCAYTSGADSRIGWSGTKIVLVDGAPAAFCDEDVRPAIPHQIPENIPPNVLLGRAIMEMVGVGNHSVALEEKWIGHLRRGNLIVSFRKYLGRDWRHWQTDPDMAIIIYSLLRFAHIGEIRNLQYASEQEITTSPLAVFTFEVVT